MNRAMLVFLLLLMLVCGGCATLSPSTSVRWQREDPQIAKLAEQVKQDIQGLYTHVNNSTTQVKNDLWPVVVMVGVVIIFGISVPMTAGLYIGGRMIRRWIAEHSYEKQKPIYELNKLGNKAGGEK